MPSGTGARFGSLRRPTRLPERPLRRYTPMQPLTTVADWDEIAGLTTTSCVFRVDPIPGDRG